MRIQVSHKTVYTYTTPARSAIQLLRVTPRNHQGQFVIDWRITVDQDCRLTEQTDALGNLTHAYTIEGPLDELTIHVEGEVETHDTNGVVAGALEPFAPMMFLRETELTAPSAPMRRFADRIAEGSRGGELALCHKLNGAIYRRMKFDAEPTTTATPASDAFEHKQGVCQDFAHVLIACARYLGMPARYVGGYLFRQDGENVQDAGHAWAEVHVSDLGWVAFDPAHAICTTEHYIRVAAAFDFLGASPVRGARYGGSQETMTVSVDMVQSGQ